MGRSPTKGQGRNGAIQSFAGIPRIVMDHPDYRGLSGNAVKLLNEFSYQYKGRNNGNLTCAWEVMRHRGFKSKATIQRARNELLSANLIIYSRQGRFTNPGGRCSLYALTWLPIDECPGKSLEAAPTKTPIRKFSMEKIIKMPGLETGLGSTQKLGRQSEKRSA